MMFLIWGRSGPISKTRCLNFVMKGSVNHYIYSLLMLVFDDNIASVFVYLNV